MASGSSSGGILRRWLADEPARLALRPSPWFIVLRTPRAVAFGVACVGAGLAIPEFTPGSGDALVWAGSVVLAGVLGWNVVEWLSRLYVMTDTRVAAVAGVLNQSVTEVSLRDVRHLAVARSLLERLTGLGTLGAASAGTGGFEVVWVNLARAHERLDAVRRAVDGAGGPEPGPTPVAPAAGRGRRALVVGLVGGIGAGKSAVARAMGELGFVVIDSDREAKAALDRPEVRDELVRWWGKGVLGAEGRVDRKVVAGIVFADAAERRRLEALVHPLVKATRAELVRRAAAEGKPGVVVDAPLLIEAGSDAECDAVVFVDAPRERRLERVRATRGWDEAELTRREAAQLPLEAKRARADAVVLNDADPATLRRRVEALVEDLSERFT